MPTFVEPNLSEDTISPHFRLQHACYAVAVGPYVYITAAHCARYAYGYEVVRVEPTRDLAWLRLPLPTAVWADIAAEVPTYAHTRRGFMTITGPYTMRGPVEKGDSGSGVYTAEGQLVGIVTACSTRPPHVSCLQDRDSYFSRVLPHEVF